MFYKTVKHFEIANFPAWGGAKTNIERWREANVMTEVQEAVECQFSDYDEDEVTDTMINDYLWFVLPDCEGFGEDDLESNEE